MRQVLLTRENTDIALSDIPTDCPIFVKNKEGKLYGMVVSETNGWIVKIGGSFGSFGHETSRWECIKRGQESMGYTFHVDI